MLGAIARSTVKVVAAGADLVRPDADGLVVLIYHRVGRRSSTEVDLPQELFAEQIAWLAETLPVVPLGEGLAALAAPGGGAAAGSSGVRVAVTFDDGTADFAELAVPVLAEHGVPATLYVSTDFVESRRDFPHAGTPISWSALADCLTTGVVAVGSHTHSHQLLDRLPADRVADELDRSVGLIAERLGVEAVDFAYPKALMGSPAADREVRARFRSAALAGARVNRPGATDVHRLARTPVQCSDGMRWFRRKAHGGLALEETIRQRLSRRRYADATT